MKNEEIYYFPKLVKKGYCIFPGITFKDLCKFGIPTIILMLIECIIPIHIIFKIICMVLTVIVALVFMLVTPIPSRENIRLKKYILTIKEFNSREKMFFIRGEKNDIK